MRRAASTASCDGPWGYADLLRILNDPKDEEYESTKEWVGDYFDPEEFDLEFINEELGTKDYGCHTAWQ